MYMPYILVLSFVYSAYLYQVFLTEDHQYQVPFQLELAYHLLTAARLLQETAQGRKVQASCRDVHGLEYPQLLYDSLLTSNQNSKGNAHNNYINHCNLNGYGFPTLPTN